MDSARNPAGVPSVSNVSRADVPARPLPRPIPSVPIPDGANQLVRENEDLALNEVTPAIRTDYATYLTTYSWRVTRNRALKRARYTCSRCGSRTKPEVHHRTYARLGHEQDADLEVLCRDCHRGHHVEQALHDLSGLGVYMKLAWEVSQSEPFDSIASLSAEIKARCAHHRIPANDYQIEKALNFLKGSLKYQPPKTEQVSQIEELAQSAEPCTCAECVTAGVNLERRHRDPYTLVMLHGEPLRRWIAARDAFRSRMASMPAMRMFWRNEPKGIDPSRVDIYAPVPREQVEYDRY